MAWAIDVEHLVVDVARVYSQIGQEPSGALDQPRWTTDVPFVDVLNRDERAENPPEPLAVEAATEQPSGLSLAGQNIDHLEPVEVLIFQILELLPEHDRARRPVAEDERCP